MPTSIVPKDVSLAADGAALAYAIIDTVRDPLLVLDHDLRIVAASRAFFRFSISSIKMSAGV